MGKNNIKQIVLHLRVNKENELIKVGGKFAYVIDAAKVCIKCF